MRVRQSMLSVWQQCSLQAKFRYIDGLPDRTNSKQLFGTYVHAALEQYVRTGDVDVAVKTFLELWDNVQPDVWTRYTSFGGLRERGLQIIHEHHDMVKWGGREVVAIEHRFLVPFGRHEIEGTVDLLELRKNHRGKQILAVADLKTGSKKPTQSELYLNTQGTLYAYATLQPEFWLGNGDGFPPVPNGEWWFEMLKDTTRRFIWYHLWSNSEIDGGTRTDVDFARCYRQIDEIERAIEYEVFVPTISGDTCGFCAYSEGPCPVRVPTREEVEQEEAAWL